jgi:hypothetical protein
MIYNHLNHGKRRMKLGSRNYSKCIIYDHAPSDKRPKVVKQRIIAGDIEVNFINGNNHKGTLLFMTDNATLQTKIYKLEDRSKKQSL